MVKCASQEVVNPKDGEIFNAARTLSGSIGSEKLTTILVLLDTFFWFAEGEVLNTEGRSSS